MVWIACGGPEEMISNIMFFLWHLQASLSFLFCRSKMNSPGIVCPSPIYSKIPSGLFPSSPGIAPPMKYADLLAYYPYSLMYNNLYMLQAGYTSTPTKTETRNPIFSYHDNTSILDLSARANSCSSPEISSDESFSTGRNILYLLVLTAWAICFSVEGIL